MSSSDQLGREINRGLAWVSLASSVVGLLEFVSLVICLKFWIVPEEFGVWGVVGPLFVAFEFAAELGLTAAVVQRDDHTEAKLSTIFWFNILAALGLYAIISGVAPLLAILYGIPVIAPLTWVFGLNLFIRAMYNIPYALMTKEMRFRESSTIRMIANLVEVACRIAFAAAGFGVWCFVIGLTGRNLVAATGFLMRRPWFPKRIWRPREAIDYIKFGLRSSAHKIVFQTYANLDYQVVTYFFGPAATGVYKAAYDLVLEPIRFISNVITGVGFAAFSRLKKDRQAIIDQFVAFTRQNLVVMGLLLVLILLAADEILIVFTNSEYAAGSTAARILAIVGVFRALGYVAPPVLDGLGHPGKTLTYQLVAAIVMPTLFVVAAATLGDELGFLSVAVAWAVGYPLAFAVLASMTLRLIGLPLLVYLRRIVGIPLCMLGGLAVGAVASQATLSWAPLPRLLIIAAGVLTATGALLSAFQGISPRAVVRALKG